MSFAGSSEHLKKTSTHNPAQVSCRINDSILYQRHGNGYAPRTGPGINKPNSLSLTIYQKVVCEKQLWEDWRYIPAFGVKSPGAAGGDHLVLLSLPLWGVFVALHWLGTLPILQVPCKEALGGLCAVVLDALLKAGYWALAGHEKVHCSQGSESAIWSTIYFCLVDSKLHHWWCSILVLLLGNSRSNWGPISGRMLYNRTFCNDGSVLYVCGPTW